jgi:chemotaxis signal transduction protein
MDRIELLDQHLLGKYCLKGVRSQEGTFRVNEKLRKRTRFGQINLMKPIPASIGMLVDQVDEIIEIPNKNIQPAPEFGTDIRVEFIQSMGRVDEKFIILLEISRVLSVTELSQLSHSINADSASIPETDSQ